MYNSLVLPRVFALILGSSFILFFTCLSAQTPDTVYAEISAIDQPFMYNRMGAAQPTGSIFALTRDLRQDGNQSVPGKARLRSTKRPRPLVLRANEGDILILKFTNLLAPYDSSGIVNAYGTNNPATVNQFQANAIYPMTRSAGIHIAGTEMADNIESDGSFNGNNTSSLAVPGQTLTYTLIAPKEGAYMLYSTGTNVSSPGGLPGGTLSTGLFGTLNVQPPKAEWYRSQVTEADMDLAVSHYTQITDGKTTKIAKNQVSKDKLASDIFPVVDYNAVYTSGACEGDPILKMYKQVRKQYRELIYSDLTALITGPNAGDFPPGEINPAFFKVPASPDRRKAYREFSIHYHEVPWAVQAFPIFYEQSNGGQGLQLSNTLATGTDKFAINYGTGGIGAEIYANRIGVGPMADCDDCAYEEFFLSSWAVGDPAMIVDIPANASAATASAAEETMQNQFLYSSNSAAVNPSIQPAIIPKAKKVLYPDDPSNVYHSYMNDHVKFRITHAGPGITHVHHQHAHQWLHTPNSDNGHYMDSQTINPGTSYTLEMVYHGSGNLNKTVGDQIFHCHFYPHFAAGMWSLWRVHDVLELGSKLDANGIVASNARALPDGEIQTGTPIPGLVPLPTVAMAPIPAKIHIDNGQVVVDDISTNPGFPFFIPGISGSRPPHPPMDFAKGAIYNADGDSIAYGPLNGGLPRHVIYEAEVPFENHSQYDWTKIIDEIKIIELPEEGTAVEKVAMDAHKTREHHTVTPKGDPSIFYLNGLPPVSGAPFADPAINLEGKAVGTKRIYKAANIQLDVVLNKQGWHFPQQRMISLWGDVSANISGKKAPEPFFFRAKTYEFVEFWHTNLVPEYYELDNFQVRTPTDIIGQHIHLVKFDVTSSDGAANGFNYEDGTLAPDLVRERIDGINNDGAHLSYKYVQGQPITNVSNYNSVSQPLVAHAPNPVWGPAPADQNWNGAQTTIQRWYADPLLNNKGEDRTIRTVFTHDHFGPSTHQQVGLYAGLLIEPANSTWFSAIDGTPLSYAYGQKSRQVYVQDKGEMSVQDGGPTSWQANIVTENKEDSYREFMLEFQDTQQAYTADSRGASRPYPQFPENFTGQDSINFVDSVANYLGWMQTTTAINPHSYPELVSFGGRGTYSMNYRNEPIPMRVAQNTGSGYTQATGDAGNLASVFSSKIARSQNVFNSQPTGGDPIASQSGINNFKYPVEALGRGMNPSDPYTPLFRAYENDRIQVRTLVGAHVTSHFFNIHGAKWYFEPSNTNSGYRSTQNMSLSEHFEMNFSFPPTDPQARDSSFTDYLYEASSDNAGRQAGLWGLMRVYDEKQTDIAALPNNDMSNPSKKQNSGCPEQAIVREFNVAAISIDQIDSSLVYNSAFGNKESDAMIFARVEDLENPNWVPEPLVLRANAGDCVVVHLSNHINPNLATNPGTYSYIGSGKTDLSVNLAPSSDVALHAELLSYDVSKFDGSDVGFNTAQTISIGEENTYVWYAGEWKDNVPSPVEYGSVVLSSADPLEQYVKGLFGALIIEPEYTSWSEDDDTRLSANIFDKSGNLLFREFVLQFQDNLSVASTGNFATVVNAVNYKSQPLSSILGNPAGLTYNNEDLTALTANRSFGNLYPETPHLVVQAGTPVRIRLLHAGGNGTGEVFNLHGHKWQEEPYTDNSKKLGLNDQSQWFGFRDQLGALNSFDLLIESAGGKNRVPGDYMYYSSTNLTFINGAWGIMSVTDGEENLVIDDFKTSRKNTLIKGRVSVNPQTGDFPEMVMLNVKGKTVAKSKVARDGTWQFENVAKKHIKRGLTITTPAGAKLKANKRNIKQWKNELNPLISLIPAKDVEHEAGQGVPERRKEGKKIQIHK